MLQIISAVIKDSEDKTKITLLFANQVKSFCMKKKIGNKLKLSCSSGYLKEIRLQGVYRRLQSCTKV